MSDFFSYDGPARPAPAAPAAPQAPPILAELGSEDWEHLIGFAARRRYAPAAVIVAAGQREVALGFIASGTVEVIDTSGARARRGEGEVFGLLGFLDGAPSSVSVVVGPDGPAEVLLLSPEALQRLAAWQPRIALALLRDLGANVAARLRRLQPGD